MEHTEPAQRPAATGRGGPSRRRVLATLGAGGLVAAASPLVRSATGATPAAGGLTFDWPRPARRSRTTPSLQVVVNPLIRRGSPIHDNVFRELRDLHADHVRFVPWYPYPRLGVAELAPPADGHTSWDFSLIDPLVEDFERATRGHSTIMNFSTIPAWMWKAPWSVADGRLSVVGGGNGRAADGLAWTDYTFAVDVTPRATATHSGQPYAQAGVLFRYDDKGNGYGFLLSNYPYSSTAQSGYIVFVPFKGGAANGTKAVALPFAIIDGHTYHLSVEVRGSTFVATVDGTVVDTVTDTQFATGTVGFREYGSESAEFDNVVVTATDGSTLLADDFSGGLEKWLLPGGLPDDPDTVDFGYSQGTELAVPVQTVADYYARLVSWYTAGGFTDEYGVYHRSGHHYRFPFWEVLNELEHGLSPQEYTELYDAIVTAIRAVSPHTQFVGVAQATPGSATYFEYFLDPANHAEGVPLDWISYHFYAHATATDTPDTYGHTGFPRADAFLAVVDRIEAVRTALAPQVRTTVDETGTILDTAGTQADPAPVPDAYWNYSAAIYAYVYAQLALKGIDVVNESQLVGYPSQYPSVSMVDWNTGRPNARYRVLQLLLAELPKGCRLVLPTGGQPSADFFVLGLRDGHARKALVVNKTNAAVSVPLDGVRGARARVVDQSSGAGPVRTDRVAGDAFTLGGYGVAVLHLG